MTTYPMEWRDEFSVGIDRLDKDHRDLIAISRELLDLPLEKRSLAMVAHIVDKLVTYTTNHFAREEAIMLEYGYPSREAHFREHLHLIRKIVDFQYDLNLGSSHMIGMRVAMFLNRWLIQHILMHDKRYSVFFQEHGLADFASPHPSQASVIEPQAKQ
ncbi:MAG: hemerythrin family protein [Magnetococcales bacterium]|nr:hemerythrin family protein [Magnetococcales bacterium]